MNEEPWVRDRSQKCLLGQAVWDLGKTRTMARGKPQLRPCASPLSRQRAANALVRGEPRLGGHLRAGRGSGEERNPEHTITGFHSAPSFSLQPSCWAPSDVRAAISRGGTATNESAYNTTVPASPTGLSGPDRWEDRELAEKSTWTNHSPQRAGALLKEAGFVRGQEAWLSPKGEAVEWELIVPAGWSDWVRSSQVIAQDLREIGLRVRVKTLDFGAWLHAVQNGDFELAMGWAQRGEFTRCSKD